MNDAGVNSNSSPDQADGSGVGTGRPRQRRRYSAPFRQKVIAEATRPGVRVAAVAGLYGVDVSLVRRWVASALARERLLSHARDARSKLMDSKPSQPGATSEGASAAAGTDPGAAFVAIPVAGGGASAAPDIRIQFNRGPTSIGVTWPVSAAADCGQWLREVMR